MVRKSYETKDDKDLAGGVGAAKLEYWTADGENPPNVDMMCRITLNPGATVGVHKHEGEAEIYHVISGIGLYNDNGTDVEVEQGNVLICYNGQTHGLVNTADMPFVFDAIIIKG
ncbi:MAG TPA: hypothetical protein DEB31_02405 [Clostridiales bacterium]|nr:hypothetical protein [Clostridiales bacterium]